MDEVRGWLAKREAQWAKLELAVSEVLSEQRKVTISATISERDGRVKVPLPKFVSDQHLTVHVLIYTHQYIHVHAVHKIMHVGRSGPYSAPNTLTHSISLQLAGLYDGPRSSVSGEPRPPAGLVRRPHPLLLQAVRLNYGTVSIHVLQNILELGSRWHSVALEARSLTLEGSRGMPPGNFWHSEIVHF